MAFDLFGGGGSNIPKFDVEPLRRRTKESTKKQREIVAGLSGQLVPLTQQFGTAQQAASKQFGEASTAASGAYKSGLEGLGTEDERARQLALERETQRQYRTLPGQQQAIRESLAATGRLRTGQAGTALAQPVLQTAQRVSDLSGVLEQQGMERQSARKEAGLQAVYETSKGTALEKLGLDKDTARTLLELGRTDLIQQAASLVGIEQNELNALLGIDITAQQANIAASQSKAARRAGIIKALTSLAGAGIGAAAGGVGSRIAGAALGAGIGGVGGDIFSGVS